MISRISLVSVLVLAAACGHGNAMKKYAAAPRIDNPVIAGSTAHVAGLTAYNEAIAPSAFDGQQICFDGSNGQSPAEAGSSRYSFVVLNTDDIDFKTAPTLTTSRVQVVRSNSQMVPVTRTVQDTVRDSQGHTIATVDRQVQELETRYETDLRICFPDARNALTEQARFMILLRESNAPRAWGIPNARPSWVWRFPTADVPAAPAVTTAAAQ